MSTPPLLVPNYSLDKGSTPPLSHYIQNPPPDCAAPGNSSVLYQGTHGEQISLNTLPPQWGWNAKSQNHTFTQQSTLNRMRPNGPIPSVKNSCIQQSSPLSSGITKIPPAQHQFNLNQNQGSSQIPLPDLSVPPPTHQFPPGMVQNQISNDQLQCTANSSVTQPSMLHEIRSTSVPLGGNTTNPMPLSSMFGQIANMNLSSQPQVNQSSGGSGVSIIAENNATQQMVSNGLVSQMHGSLPEIMNSLRPNVGPMNQEPSPPPFSPTMMVPSGTNPPVLQSSMKGIRPQFNDISSIDVDEMQHFQTGDHSSILQGSNVPLGSVNGQNIPKINKDYHSSNWWLTGNESKSSPVESAILSPSLRQLMQRPPPSTQNPSEILPHFDIVGNGISNDLSPLNIVPPQTFAQMSLVQNQNTNPLASLPISQPQHPLSQEVCKFKD